MHIAALADGLIGEDPIYLLDGQRSEWRVLRTGALHFLRQYPSGFCQGGAPMLLDNLEDVLAEQDQMICRGMLIMIAAPIELLMQLQQCCI